jgi:hypothetical protein
MLAHHGSCVACRRRCIDLLLGQAPVRAKLPSRATGGSGFQDAGDRYLSEEPNSLNSLNESGEGEPEHRPF